MDSLGEEEQIAFIILFPKQSTAASISFSVLNNNGVDKDELKASLNSC